MMGRQRLRGSKPEKLRSFQRQRPVGRMGLSRLSVMKKQKQSKQYHILLLWMRLLLREISEPPSIWRIMSLDWGRDLLPAWMLMWSLRKRGHRLGRIIREGQAIANTGIPGIIGGYGKERVIHSENAGVFHGIAHIGDLVKKGDLIAKVDDAPVYATLDGVLRGILRDGLPVPEHFKIADIDPCLSERENCFTISDKASAIAGGVLRAICIYENGLRSGEGRK